MSKTPKSDEPAGDVVTSAKPAYEAPAIAQLKTPESHARACGHASVQAEVVAFGGRGERPLPGKVERFSWQHAAAAQLHGWAEHAHHEGTPIELTEQDYRAALAAAANEAGARDVTPHEAALSPHAPYRKRQRN